MCDFAQLITYRIEGNSHEDYLDWMVSPDAPILTEVDGLISKVWLRDGPDGAGGGSNPWEAKAKMDAFMTSELVAAVISRPYLKEFHSVDCAVSA